MSACRPFAPIRCGVGRAAQPRRTQRGAGLLGKSSANTRQKPRHSSAMASDDRELSDAQWQAVRVVVPEWRQRGRPWRQHRQVINGILWVLGTGASWRSLPSRYGPWQTAYSRYRRWRHDGTWDRIQVLLQDTHED
ncbi:transposase [Saccharopolyspora griseoalba]|uniref:Transposase n=1 Tax=Saccharopolyspora griseoalba TaxID=1431848 RepID=A0ABW2LTU5_9PSEU